MKRHSLRIHVSCCLLGLALLSDVSGSAESLDPDGLLASLQSFDNTIMKEFSLTANVVHPVPMQKADSERIVSVVKLAHKDSVWAYRMDLDKDATPEPRFAGINPGAGAIEFGNDRGSYVVSRALWRVWLWEPEQCRARDEHEVMVVGIDDSIAKRDDNQGRVFYEKAVEPFQNPDVYLLVLTSGRLFSQYLTAIESVASMENGMMRCEAVGVYPGAERRPCRWELVVEPDAAFLVREAKAYWLEKDILAATFSNQGLQHSEHGPYPATGRFAHGDDGVRAKYWQGDGVWDIAYLSLESRSENRFVSELRDEFTGDFPAGTLVLDSRAEPSLSYVIESAQESIAPIELP